MLVVFLEVVAVVAEILGNNLENVFSHSSNSNCIVDAAKQVPTKPTLAWLIPEPRKFEKVNIASIYVWTIQLVVCLHIGRESKFENLTASWAD